MSDHTNPSNTNAAEAQFLAPETLQQAGGEEQGSTRRFSISATYSPDDNKLRLSSPSRLDSETYARVKAAGFAWAPRQEQFVAPMWTPTRADLCIELAGGIDDEDSTLMQRAEDRADRFEGYQDKRAQDAAREATRVRAIADNIPFGQPILVGHHSERHARKHAEQIEGGMRRAVKAFETSQYWKDRAAAAIGHARFKELPAVRARRIKGIEADKRKAQRSADEAAKCLSVWQRENLSLAAAVAVAGAAYSSRSYSLADFPRDPPASQYEGPMSLADALERGVVSVGRARGDCLKSYGRTVAWYARWIEHYQNRLAYENAMLQEQGGKVADRFDIQVGGTVLVGGDWVLVVRVNKSGGQVVSVTTTRRYVRVVGIEEVSDYKAPSVDQAQKVRAATKLPPMANYPGEGFVHISKADWDKLPKDYRGTRALDSTNTTGRHRVSAAMGCFVSSNESDMNKRHRYQLLFITDAKRVDPPALQDGERPQKLSALAAEAVAAVEPTHQAVSREPLNVEQRSSYEAPGSSEFDAMREQLRQGVQVVTAPQLFPTPSHLAARMVDASGVKPGMRVLEPSAGTGRLLEALPGVVPFGPNRQTALQVVAVEVSAPLAAKLDASGLAGVVHCADFLTTTVDQLGAFDVVIMNPPFLGGIDVQHIKHALTMVKPGGRLVALCANGPRQREKLQPVVDACGGDWEDLPADTFKSEGTGVRVAMLTIRG